MAQFDVHMVDGQHVIDCQSDFLSHYDSRLMVPLIPVVKGPLVAKRLNPTFNLGGEQVAMYTQYAAAMPKSAIGHPVESFSDRQDDIRAALDMLITGF